MFGGMTFDELNQLIENPRSEPYEKYFSLMDISDEDKEKRVSLAEKLEDNFLYVLILLFTMQQYSNTVDWERARAEFESGYLAAVSGVITVDEYMESYIRKFSYEVIDSTKAHESDPWYYSRDRAVFQSENESQMSFNHQEHMDAIKAGKTRKQWVDIRDKRERETHRAVGGTIKPINEPFLVGNSLMQVPKDVSLGAESSEIVNCRCSVRFL